MSLVLVHEGVHATGVLDYNWLYDEMMGRQTWKSTISVSWPARGS